MRMLAPSADDRPATALDVKRLLVDAVPEARSFEPHDVAALLRALVPKEIDQRDDALAAAAPSEDDDPATERRVDPAEALHQLTVPAVVLPETRGRSARTPALVVIGLVAIALLVGVTRNQKAKEESAVTFPEAPPIPALPSSPPAASPVAEVAAPSAVSAPPRKAPARSPKKKKKRCEVVGNVELCE